MRLILRSFFKERGLWTRLSFTRIWGSSYYLRFKGE